MKVTIYSKDKAPQTFNAIVSIQVDSESYLFTISHVVAGKIDFKYFPDWIKVEIEN